MIITLRPENLILKQDFEYIVANYNKILFKISKSYTKTDDDFKDLYQEILVQLWQSYTSFKGNSKLSTWTYRVAINTAITFKKKEESTRTKSLDEDTYEKIPDSENELISDNTFSKKNHLLYNCINKLTKEERAIILLYLENNTYEKISEILGITTTLVGVKIHRIKRKLLNCLKKSGYERF